MSSPCLFHLLGDHLDLRISSISHNIFSSLCTTESCLGKQMSRTLLTMDSSFDSTQSLSRSHFSTSNIKFNNNIARKRETHSRLVLSECKQLSFTQLYTPLTSGMPVGKCFYFKHMSGKSGHNSPTNKLVFTMSNIFACMKIKI